jgi:aryl sulfotransferase
LSRRWSVRLPTSDDYDWLEKDGFPFWPFWSHIQSWWNIRHLPNVLLLHYNNLRSDLTDELHTIARFLDIEINDSSLPLILHYCSMGYMRTWAATSRTILPRV